MSSRLMSNFFAQTTPLGSAIDTYGSVAEELTDEERAALGLPPRSSSLTGGCPTRQPAGTHGAPCGASTPSGRRSEQRRAQQQSPGHRHCIVRIVIHEAAHLAENEQL